MWITFDKKKIGRCISLKRKSSAHAAEDRIQFSLEYKVFNLSNGLLIFATFFLSRGFVTDVYMTFRDVGKIQRLEPRELSLKTILLLPNMPNLDTGRWV